MCETSCEAENSLKAIPLREAVGMALAHDITEIREGEFKGRAFKKGHVVREEDIAHLQRIGKERLFVLSIGEGELHEDEAVLKIASALSGEGVVFESEPKEGKVNLIAQHEGLLKIDTERLFEFNLLGDVMCSTLHNNTVVKRGQVVAGTRAIPLVVKKSIIEQAERVLRSEAYNDAVISVKPLGNPKAGVVITGNEVYYGRIRDAFAPVIRSKVEQYGGEIVGIYYAPDDVRHIEGRLTRLIQEGADLLITTGGMSVDPDDVTRFAVTRLGAMDVTYGSAVLPGAMFMVSYISVAGRKGDEAIPILSIPACGMYHKRTVFDLILPRVLAGEKIGRRELAALGHGGLCINCKDCRYPVCPFGK